MPSPTQGLRKETVHIPLPTSKAALVATLERTFAKDFVERVVIDEGGILVTWSRAEHEELTVGADNLVPTQKLISDLEMVEIEPKDNWSETLSSSLLFLMQEGLEPTHLIVSSVGAALAWAELPKYTRLPKSVDDRFRFLGMELVVEGTVPIGTGLICGSETSTRNSDLIELGIKVAMNNK